MLTIRHKVFVSFHEADSWYKDIFAKLMGDDIVDRSVSDADIDTDLKVETIRTKIRDEFIADESVTVVLIGQCTWQRKYVVWEIGSSLRDTKLNSRCGLLGILLPTNFDYGKTEYQRCLIPPRLSDNASSSDPFAAIYNWPDPWNSDKARNWIHWAFERRSKKTPDNSRLQFSQNRTGECASGWKD